MAGIPTHNVNESRTIDLDIIVFNGVVVNGDFERYAFVRDAVLELAPELIRDTLTAGPVHPPLLGLMEISLGLA